MVENTDDLLPMAKEIQKHAALMEAEKAEQDARRLIAAEAEKRALIDRLREHAAFPLRRRSSDH